MPATAYQLVARALECDAASLSEDSAMGTHPAWDSLGQLRVMLALEETFSIPINDETIRQHQTMAGILHTWDTLNGKDRTPSKVEPHGTTDLAQHLKELGVSPGHHVVVHSRLSSLGLVDGGAAAVYDALWRALGPSGTIVVPGYTIGMPQDEVFDPRATAPLAMGSLADYVWKEGQGVRSPCPIHSHIAVGDKAGLVGAVSGDASIGEGCDFQVFREHGFHLLMLGCSFNEGASYMHYVEYTAGVPYRAPLSLPRQRRDGDGQVRGVDIQYFGRPDQPGSGEEVAENYNAVEQRMLSEGLLTRVECTYGYSTYMTIADAHDCATRMVRKDPYAMVLRKPVSA